MKKIAILGGTFNPIHNGHIMLAENAMKKYNMESVWIMPNNKPGYKETSDIASASDRCNMVSLAIEDYPYMMLSELEICRSGITYTADTVEQLSGKYPDVIWYFIMGADSLFYFKDWYKPAEILKYTHILVAVRDEITVPMLQKQIDMLSKMFNPCNISILNCDAVDISSSMIREYVRCGKQINDMVPYKVCEYIVKKGLYKNEPT